jgi:AcrR family transcriptional regulator
MSRTSTSTTPAAAGQVAAGQPPAGEVAAGGGRAGGRPLRRDAQRNRERILTAAAELFATKGLGTSLDEIATAAGIGIGTVYRRFPDKNELIEALFEVGVERVVAIAEESAADPDPWHGLVSFLDRSTELEAADRGLSELLRLGLAGTERITQVSATIAPLAAQLLRRAQDAGRVRPDLVPGDLLLAKLMWITVAQLTPETPDLWRRYFLLFVEAIEARPGQEQQELPHPPVDLEQLRQALSSAARLLRR